MTISVPRLWNSFHNSRPSSSTFGSSGSLSSVSESFPCGGSWGRFPQRLRSNAGLSPPGEVVLLLYISEDAQWGIERAGGKYEGGKNDKSILGRGWSILAWLYADMTAWRGEMGPGLTDSCIMLFVGGKQWRNECFSWFGDSLEQGKYSESSKTIQMLKKA